MDTFAEFRCLVWKTGFVGDWGDVDGEDEDEVTYIEAVIKLRSPTGQWSDALDNAANQINNQIRGFVSPSKRALAGARIMRRFVMEASEENRLSFVDRPGGGRKAAIR